MRKRDREMTGVYSRLELELDRRFGYSKHRIRVADDWPLFKITFLG